MTGARHGARQAFADTPRTSRGITVPVHCSPFVVAMADRLARIFGTEEDKWVVTCRRDPHTSVVTALAQG